MTIHLPDDLRAFVLSEVQGGRFSSPDEAITEAVRLLQQQEDAESSHALAGIHKDLDDVQAGRTQPLAEAFADIRRDLNPSRGS